MCSPLASLNEHARSAHSDPEIAQYTPSSAISKAAFELATSHLHPAILNHSMRVYLYAKSLAEQSSSTYAANTAKHDFLFIACILHDIGTVDAYNGSQRFEVEGADAAKKFLLSQGILEGDAHAVWMAIALHTSPHIAERINDLCRLVREAVLIDFGKAFGALAELETLKTNIEGRLPRLGVEKALGDAVVEQAVAKPEKAPAASWPNNLYKAYLAEPGWNGVNKGF